MLTTFIKALSISLFLICYFESTTAHAANAPSLRADISKLFSHKTHSQALNGSNLNCTSCHSFSVRSPTTDPLAPNVDDGYLKPSFKVCHECHMGKVISTRINPCTVCHISNLNLAPENHKRAWRVRHGFFAQLDSETCKSCHQENQNSCAKCHTSRNTMRPVVHRPNFRMTHSIEARANPSKCVVCHTVADSCSKCHTGGTSR